MKWVGSASFLAPLALFFSSFLFFYDLLQDRFLLTERDLGPYFIPPRFFWVESVKNWDFPLWNPYQFSGHPFFANPQHAILYPLSVLFFFLPFDVAFNAIVILHFFLGGLFTYLLLKDLKVNSAGALLSGLIFMLSGYLLSVHSLLTILLSSVWTPLIMIFFLRAMRSPGLKNELLTSISMAISFLGGGIEIVYGNFFVLLLMVIFSVDPYAHTLIRFRSLLIVIVAFFFLSAIQLIPFLELWIHSVRGTGIPYQEATIWSFAPRDVLLFFLPDVYGYFVDMKRYWVNQCWFKTLYTGGLPFILSLLYFLLPVRIDPVGGGIPCGKHPKGVSSYGKNRMLYLSLIVLSLFLSLGRHNPLYPLVFDYIPFFDGIRYPAKFLYLFVLVLSITAGLGFQRLTEPSTEGNRRLKAALLVSSLISGIILLLLVLGHREMESFLKARGFDAPDFNFLAVNLFHAKRFFFYLCLFFLILRIGSEVRWRVWAAVLLILFLTADLFGNMGFYGKEKTEDYFRKTRIQEIISSDPDQFRVFSTAKTISMDVPILLGHATPIDHLRERHPPSMNLLHRLRDIWGLDVVHLRRTRDLYRTFTSTPSISSSHLVDLYGVKYIISVTPIEKDRRFELVYSRLEGLRGKKEELLRGNTIKLYRKEGFFPRAWLVNDFSVMDPEGILLRLKSKDFHPDKEVLLEETPLMTAPKSETENPKSLGRPRKKVEIVSESNNRLLLRVETPENGFLVLSDTYFPGWKAYVDGEEEKIYRANYTFRAIPLRTGIHEVEFVYRPWSFRLGALITLLTLMGGIGMGLIRRRSAPIPEGRG